MKPLITVLLLFGVAAAEPFECTLEITRQDPSMDWWYAVPEPFVPHITRIDSVAKGEYFSIIPFFNAYGADSNGMAHIIFDAEIIRPDGSVAEAAQNCIAHFDEAPASGRIPSQAVLHPCFGGNDPYGEYRIKVTAYDVVSILTNRQVATIHLKPFELETLTEAECNAVFAEYTARPNPSRAFAAFLQTQQSFFSQENEPVWSAIWFFKTVFEQNTFLVPHLLDAFRTGSPKQQRDIILVLALMSKANELPKLSYELGIIRRTMEAGRVPGPYGTITNGKQLDILWAEFFATGRIAPLRQLVQALELVKYKGTLQKIDDGQLNPEDATVQRSAMLEGVFQSALLSLCANATEHPLVLHYCIGILESEELEKTTQSCLAILIESIVETQTKPQK